MIEEFSDSTINNIIDVFEMAFPHFANTMEFQLKKTFSKDDVTITFERLDHNFRSYFDVIELRVEDQEIQDQNILLSLTEDFMLRYEQYLLSERSLSFGWALGFANIIIDLPNEWYTFGEMDFCYHKQRDKLEIVHNNNGYLFCSEVVEEFKNKLKKNYKENEPDV